MAELDNYAKLLGVPGALCDEFALLDKNRAKIDADFEDEKKRIAEDFSSEEKTSKELRDNVIREAEERSRGWNDKAREYEGLSEKAHQRALGVMRSVVGAPAKAEMDRIVRILVSETQTRENEHKPNDNAGLVNGCIKDENLGADTQKLAQEMRDESGRELKQAKDAAEKKYDAEHDSHTMEREFRTAHAGRQHAIRREMEEDAFSERVVRNLLPDKIHRIYNAMHDLQPNYEVFDPAAEKEFPQGIQFGFVGYDVTEHAKDPLKLKTLNGWFGYALKEVDGRRYLMMPYGYFFGDRKFSTMFEFLPENKAKAQFEISNLALNLYMSIPANKCWCTFIDPGSQGDTFAMFARLGERDENGKGDERVIDTKLWSGEKEIEERLQLLIEHTRDIIQRCLQGQYENILEYNKDAGINAEPLRFVIVMDFPKHFTEQSLDYLESILDNGPKTGVYTLIAGDYEEMERWAEDSAVGRIRRRIGNTVFAGKDYGYTQETTADGKLRYFPLPGPTKEQSARIIQGIRDQLGKKIEITYPMVSRNLPSRPDYWFQKSAYAGISVPIGMEGAGHIINLQFGPEYGSYSAMIDGTTGSGKTTLIHTIIQSLIFNYSPEDVQLYLLDFKQGVEFKCYADYKLQNFRVISVETEQEFGLAVLKELDKEMVRRSGKFRGANVATIEEYWKYRGERGESHADMPRLVVIFDELQALLTDEDSEIVKQCVARIKTLVTQGARAFGIHLILSTQTFENVKGLDNGVYSNIHTRFALKSTSESAAILLNDDNEIARRLVNMDPGQGVINTNAGDRNANRTFRGAIIHAAEREQWMHEVHDLQMEVMTGGFRKPRILLSGPEDDADNPLSVFASAGERPLNYNDPSWHLYIGESLTMQNTYLPALRSSEGQNLLIAGSDTGSRGLSRMIMGYSALSILYETIRQYGEITGPMITLIDLRGRDYSADDFDMLKIIEEMVPEAFRVIPREELLHGIDSLYAELQGEMRQGRDPANAGFRGGNQQFVMFYALNRAKQLTTGTYEQSPKDKLEEMFAKGPEHGMNFIVWANDPGGFLENYSMSLRYFNDRLAYGMEDKEYKAITGENGPTYSSPSNAISYNPYDDNQKIRMYKRPTEEWLRRFLDNVRNYVRAN